MQTGSASFPDKFSLMLNIHPNFDDPVTQKFTVAYNEVPKYKQCQVVADGGLFIFLIDRSGSMGGERIREAKKALILFL